MTQPKCCLVLKPGNTLFEGVDPFFPNGLPITTPFPITKNKEGIPCFQVDPKRLTEEQVLALAQALKTAWLTDGLSMEEAVAEIRRGLLISDHWAEKIEGNPEFESPLARKFAFELNQLSNEPIIELKISPAAAFQLLMQLQLAFRHPGNTGWTRLQAEEVARELQEAVCPPGSALHEMAERGWHQEFDQ